MSVEWSCLTLLYIVYMYHLFFRRLRQSLPGCTFLLLAILLVAGSCSTVPEPELLLGGDISLLPSYEQHGTVYRDSAGNAVEPLAFFRDNGWNAIRVRLFVEPDSAPGEHKDEGVCQDLDYVSSFGKRIKEAGFRFMLDFHYSDTWADPGKQFIPARWANHSMKALCDSVGSYTRQVLQRLVSDGAEPELIQVGNEITNGMLWPVGRLNHDGKDNYDVLCSMIGSGVKACREVCPKARLIIHTEKAGEWPVTKEFYDQLKVHGTDYDIIGLSYYPMWHDRIPVLGATLDSIAARYPEKEVMIVETAAYYSHENDKWATPDQFSEFYSISPEGQTAFTRELVAELKHHDNVKGLFWWFPEENACGNSLVKSWINRGLFDNRTGRVLPAFREFCRYGADNRQ